MISRFPRLICRLFAAGMLVSSCETLLAADPPPSFVTSNGIKMILIRAGSFQMGNDRETDPALLRQSPLFTHGGLDERPVRRVTISRDFYISETEVTAHQFAKYQEDHEDISHFSPYATGISWEDAEAYAEWMSRNEGKTFRLPTEAEWEYVARAGSDDHFSSGAQPPRSGEPNRWGVKNMHTDALEWVHDWHAHYPDANETDPIGAATGAVRVVRGGGLNMPYHDLPEKYPNDGRAPFYRRSANRSGMIPSYRGRHNIGIRLVCGEMPPTRARPAQAKLVQQFVRQKNPFVTRGPSADQPWYRRRDVLPIPPDAAEERTNRAAGLHPTILGKNHNPGLAVAPNGDLIAFYFSSSVPAFEDLTNVSIIGTRLRFGADEWDMPSAFSDIPGAKDIGPVVTRDGQRLLFASGGGGLDGVVFRWQSSDDNGATWSPLRIPVILGRRGDYFPQPIANFFRGADGTLYLPSDGSGGNSFLWASRDNGETWFDTGGRTGGRHTLFVVRSDGAFHGLGGKASAIDGYMPQSISTDGGKSWTVEKTTIPAQGPNQQRPSFIRLASGRLFLAADWVDAAGNQPAGINRKGVYVALSEDEGKTWITKDLPDVPPHVRWLFRDKPGYVPSPLKEGTLGYSIAAQGPNGLIHLLNSATHPVLHFEMNEAWILDPQTGPSKTQSLDNAVETTRETHPSGRKKAEWTVRRDANGRVLLHGRETHWYESGAKEYEVTWNDGAKTGLESHWSEHGQPVWTWDHRADGTRVWTQFRADGSKRHESTWRGKRAHGPSREWNRAGALIAEHEFADGTLIGK